MNVRHPMGVLNSFSIKNIFCLTLIFFIKNIFFDQIDLRLFYFHMMLYGLFRAVAHDILNNFLLLEPNEALGLRFFIN